MEFFLFGLFVGLFLGISRLIVFFFMNDCCLS